MRQPPREGEPLAMDKTQPTRPVDDQETRAKLEAALFEMKRVIVGQDLMLERVLITLLAGGHLLIEGVPGLAKTLTIKTLADVLGGVFKRVQFTPDLVPADLVGTRIYRPTSGEFDVELGPVFCNFLLADEINRAPAKVQSALLEVMQEKQVTIGRQTFRVEEPFLVMATQNPIESEGTYPLPEAQVDRFMMKVVVDYPDFGEETTVVDRSLEPQVHVRRVLSPRDLLAFRAIAAHVYVDSLVKEYAVALVLGTRAPTEYALERLAPLISFGASPRGSINLVHAGRALALLRGRRYVLPGDVRDVAKDVLRHRLSLSYEGLAEGATADALLDDVLATIPVPKLELGGERSA
jgi:MoxR-like ATPase